VPASAAACVSTSISSASLLILLLVWRLPRTSMPASISAGLLILLLARTTCPS